MEASQLRALVGRHLLLLLSLSLSLSLSLPAPASVSELKHSLAEVHQAYGSTDRLPRADSLIDSYCTWH